MFDLSHFFVALSSYMMSLFFQIPDKCPVEEETSTVHTELTETASEISSSDLHDEMINKK